MSKTALIATGIGAFTAIALACIIAFSVNASYERDAVLSAQVQIENYTQEQVDELIRAMVWLWPSLVLLKKLLSSRSMKRVSVIMTASF